MAANQSMTTLNTTKLTAATEVSDGIKCVTV